MRKINEIKKEKDQMAEVDVNPFKKPEAVDPVQVV